MTGSDSKCRRSFPFYFFFCAASVNERTVGATSQPRLGELIVMPEQRCLSFSLLFHSTSIDRLHAVCLQKPVNTTASFILFYPFFPPLFFTASVVASKKGKKSISQKMCHTHAHLFFLSLQCRETLLMCRRRQVTLGFFLSLLLFFEISPPLPPCLLFFLPGKGKKNPKTKQTTSTKKKNGQRLDAFFCF